MPVEGLETLDKITKSVQGLKKRKKATSKNLKAIVTSPWRIQSVKTLYEKASLTDVPDSSNFGPIKLGNIRTPGNIGILHASAGETEKSIIKDFVSRKNKFVLNFPDLGATDILLVPKGSELTAKKRSKSRWDIFITDKAVARVRRRLEKTLTIQANADVAKEIVTINKGIVPKGLEQQMNGTLGAAVDRIVIEPKASLLSNLQLTEKVRAEMKKRMGSGSADSKLNYRTGAFVRSVDVKVDKSNNITYAYDKRRFGIHEKEPAGTLTKIVPISAKVLKFFDNKEGKTKFRKWVVIRSRPIIKKSIRSVALNELGKRFNIREV